MNSSESLVIIVESPWGTGRGWVWMQRVTHTHTSRVALNYSLVRSATKTYHLQAHLPSTSPLSQLAYSRKGTLREVRKKYILKCQAQCWELSLCYLVLSPQQSWEERTIIISILQIRKQKLREMKLVDQGHTTSKCWKRDSNCCCFML